MALEGSGAFWSAPSRFLAGLDPGLVWAAALLAALAYSVRSARRLGLDPRSMYLVGVCALAGGLWGSQLLGLIVHGWQGGPFAWLRVWEGGKSYYGGLLGGALAGAAFLRFRRLSLLSYADAVVPAVALGYAIGRLGCFLNGDDYGTLSHLPWAVRYAVGTEAHAAHAARGWIGPGEIWSLPIHPVQLYASLLGLGLFLLLATWRPQRLGNRFCRFMVLYGAARFAMEWLRGDFRAVLGPLSLPQVFSLLFVIAGWGIWVATGRAVAHRKRADLPVVLMSAQAKRCGPT